MYDSHIHCKDYIDDIINGDIDDYDIEAISEQVQELYDEGKMQATQYDDLMRYIQELE